MRKPLNLAVKILLSLFVVNALPIALIVWETFPTTNLRDFVILGRVITELFWILPLTIIMRKIDVPNTMLSLGIYGIPLVLFAVLFGMTFTLIRRFSPFSTSRTIWISVLFSIMLLETPGIFVYWYYAELFSPNPVNIRNAYFSEKPIVGQITTLYVELYARTADPDVEFQVYLGEDLGNQIHLVSGEPVWKGSFDAKQSKTIALSICVKEEGIWSIEFYIYPSSYPPGDSERIVIESTSSDAKLIWGRNYKYDPEKHAQYLTPQPITVSPDCSGEK